LKKREENDAASFKTECNEKYLEECLSLARSLPEYFNPPGLAAMEKSLLEDELYLVVDNVVTAFAAVRLKQKAFAELSWMAVSPLRHRQGIGTALLRFMERDLVRRGVRLLLVKTLAPESGYPPYEPTRRFYRKNGFLLLETVDPYPRWGPGNPCAFYVKILQ
jgi:GNAT superfamily N-acetyltransferase